MMDDGAKLDPSVDPGDLVIGWEDDALVLTAPGDPLEVVLTLVSEAGSRSDALDPMAVTVGAEAVVIRPEWPQFSDLPGDAPATIHGYAYVTDASGFERGVRTVPDRLVVDDRPDEGFAPEELDSLLPLQVELEEGTAIADVDPEVYAEQEVSP